jgi:hypothetical protein
MMRGSQPCRKSWPVRLLPILIFPGFLGACSVQGGGSAPVERVELATIPSTFKKPCARPQTVPERDEYSVDEILNGWLLDATHLETCRKRHQSLVGAIEARDAIQSGVITK